MNPDELELCNVSFTFYTHGELICRMNYYENPFCYIQLTPCLSSGKDHKLGINVDVTLWLNYQNSQNKPPLQAVQDYVIVTNELHHEFDDFSNREATFDVSVFPFVELLQFLCASQGIPALLRTETPSEHVFIIVYVSCMQWDTNRQPVTLYMIKTQYH